MKINVFPLIKQKVKLITVYWVIFEGEIFTIFVNWTYFINNLLAGRLIHYKAIFCSVHSTKIVMSINVNHVIVWCIRLIKINSNWIMFNAFLCLSPGNNLVITQWYFSYHPAAFFDPPMHWNGNMYIYIMIYTYAYIYIYVCVYIYIYIE